MTDPSCATCHPSTPRPGEVVGTTWRCPQHQAAWDEIMGGIDTSMFQPASVTAPLSFAELGALVDRVPKPAADRFVCARDTWKSVKRAVPTSPYPAPCAPIMGMRVLIDDDMPSGYWEIRDGDRVVSSAATALYEQTLKRIREGVDVPDGRYTDVLEALLDSP